MFSIDAFHGQYETDDTRIAVNNRDFRLLVPRAIDKFINPDDPARDFPLWAKVWEASLILADYLSRQKPEPGQQILEIGCGLGLVGITAAAFYHRVTLTEHNSDALAFARANAHVNGCANLAIARLDWRSPDLTGTFHRIVGSEVVFNETDFDPLLNLFQTFLEPDGEIILTTGMRKTAMHFFGKMQEHYSIKAQKRTLRSEDDTKDILLCIMSPRPVEKNG